MTPSTANLETCRIQEHSLQHCVLSCHIS